MCRIKSNKSENSVVRNYLPCGLVSIQEFWIITPVVQVLYTGCQKPQFPTIPFLVIRIRKNTDCNNFKY